MKLLVTGSGGQLGRELLRAPRARGLALEGLDHRALDIARADDVRTALEERAPEALVNAAAYTAVDRAEAEPAAAFAANRDGPRHLAEACAARGIPLVHVSTDYVFDGAKASPYTEADPVNPLGVYGASKEAGEQAVRARLARHVILRTSAVYGVYGANFVKTMLRLARERKEIRVVADQVVCPTAAADFAEAILRLVPRLDDAREAWGTYHYCGAGALAWSDFARAIFELGFADPGERPRVVEISTADYPTPARRPRCSVLDCARIRRTFGIVPRPWREGLGAVIAELRARGTVEEAV